MRCDKAGRVFYHGNGKRHFFDADTKTYFYYDMEARKKQSIKLEDLKALSNTLPAECQEILLTNKVKMGPISMEDQSKLLKLCSISISCWHGAPGGKLKYNSMAEYSAEFYIQMVKFLTRNGKSRWTHERSKWPNFVKFIRLATIASMAESWSKLKPILESFSGIIGGIENVGDNGWEAVEENFWKLQEQLA